MTNEKAIEHGKEQLEIFGGEHKKFIQKSIEALENQSEYENIIASLLSIYATNEALYISRNVARRIVSGANGEFISAHLAS